MQISFNYKGLKIYLLFEAPKRRFGQFFKLTLTTSEMRLFFPTILSEFIAKKIEAEKTVLLRFLTSANLLHKNLPGGGVEKNIFRFER